MLASPQKHPLAVRLAARAKRQVHAGFDSCISELFVRGSQLTHCVRSVKSDDQVVIYLYQDLL